MHDQPSTVTADHPAVLVGGDAGPTPVEYVLHAIAACLTAGMVNIAAARGVAPHEVSPPSRATSTSTGILGLDDSVRNGYQGIKVHSSCKVTPPRRSWPVSWSAPSPVRPCSTS